MSRKFSVQPDGPPCIIDGNFRICYFITLMNGEDCMFAWFSRRRPAMKINDHRGCNQPTAHPLTSKNMACDAANAAWRVCHLELNASSCSFFSANKTLVTLSSRRSWEPSASIYKYKYKLHFRSCLPWDETKFLVMLDRTIRRYKGSLE